MNPPNFLFILLIFLYGCNAPSPAPAVNFYYFKTTYSLSPAEKQYLQNLETKKLYLRLFDVDVNRKTGAAEMVAPLNFKEFPPAMVEIVPLVFITNATLQQLNQEQLFMMQKEIEKGIDHYLNDFAQRGAKVSALQFDCDWSASTQEAFFNLLKHFRKKYPGHNISCTIRLHQLKLDERMQVPPADEGVLMFYNTGNIKDPNEKNSILNLQVAGNYLKHLENYPLRLDLALPVFSWGVQYRYGKIVNLLRGISQSALDEDTLLKKTGHSMYHVIQSHYLNGSYIYKNDEIRFESATQEQLLQAGKMLRGSNSKPVQEVIFYHLDEGSLVNFSSSFLKEAAANVNSN